jgi:hypothetical protein
MSKLHLPIERFAELVDGGIAPPEREHLVGCSRCAGELEAYRRVVALAADERRRIAPPLSSWNAISAQLRTEGLIIAEGDGPVRRPTASQLWMRRAAAVALLVGAGAIGGRLSSGMPVGEAFAWRAFFAPADSAQEQAGNALLVSDTGTRFRSADEALVQLEQAQRAYEEAAAFLAAHDTSTSAGVADQYRTRLAALDRASRTFEAALTDAPRDPVLNQYFMATMNAREATMQRLGTALPVSTRLGRF